MAHESSHNHFLFLVFPAQGHINPALELAKRLVGTGAQVTFVTCMSAHRRLVKNAASFPDGLTFEPLFNADDNGFKSAEDVDQYLFEMRGGGDAISGLIEKAAGEGRQVSCILYTLLLRWTIEVVNKFQLFSALLWVQPATVFDVYCYYFNGYRDLIIDKVDDPEYVVQLRGLPLLRSEDLPSSLLPSNAHSALYEFFQEQFGILTQYTKTFRVIVNTFDELELESLQALEKFNLMGVGPLIPMALLNGEHPGDNSSGGDLFDRSNEYLKWLDSQDKSSVVYVSFGSLAVLSDQQMEALARGLVGSGRPFLWVIRDSKEDGKYADMLCGEHNGMVVPWCSQVEVLNHDSVGCFVTHCGWNSTLEAVAMGVPMVTFPQWNDQGTNSKLIVDVWKMGVKVRPNEEDKIVDSEEIIRCLKRVMESEDLRNKAKKWKDLARQAVKRDGSSQRNLLKFIEEIRQFYS